ncbi:hypothetical protein EH220_00405 [bacterium]|nr:MAG: hypothetical protein EH220_00405 [bacterium]
MRQALCLQLLHADGIFLLPFQKQIHIPLQQVQLTLQVDPTANDQRGQQKQLYEHRDIQLPIQPPPVYLTLHLLPPHVM